MAYARPSQNENVSTIKDLKSTVQQAIAENPSNELQTSANAANQSLSSSTAAAKDLMNTAGVMSSIQSSAKAQAMAQAEASKKSNDNIMNTSQLDIGNNRGYIPFPKDKQSMDPVAIATARRVANAQERVDSEAREENASNQLKLNRQQTESAQAIAASQAAATVQAAQYGALAGLLGKNGGGGASRHQYW